MVTAHLKKIQIRSSTAQLPMCCSVAVSFGFRVGCRAGPDSEGSRECLTWLGDLLQPGLEANAEAAHEANPERPGRGKGRDSVSGPGVSLSFRTINCTMMMMMMILIMMIMMMRRRMGT